MLFFALLIGALYGYVSVKGQFCMNSGFSNVIRNQDTTKLKSFVTAILLQLLLLPLLFSLLYSYPPTQGLLSGIALPPLYLIGSAFGGFFFGIFMYYTAGCGAGIFYKIGEKNSGAILAVLGFILGIYLTEKGFLQFLREAAQETILIEQKSIWKGDFSIWISSLISLFSALILYRLFRNNDQTPKGAVWGWKKTGLLMGMIGTLAWLIALWGNTGFSMGIIPGILDSLDLNYSWGVLFVVGILVGAFFSTRKDSSKRFSLPKKELIFKRFFGGLGLGVSGSIAAGCTVGHGLTFAPLLGIGSLGATLFIFLGSGLVGYLTKP